MCYDVFGGKEMKKISVSEWLEFLKTFDATKKFDKFGQRFANVYLCSDGGDDDAFYEFMYESNDNVAKSKIFDRYVDWENT